MCYALGGRRQDNVGLVHCTPDRSGGGLFAVSLSRAALDEHGVVSRLGRHFVKRLADRHALLVGHDHAGLVLM